MSENWDIRYARAAEYSPVRFLGKLSGAHIEGYWLDDKTYFFLDQAPDPTTGTMLEMPATFDVGKKCIQRLLTLDERLAIERSFVPDAGDNERLPLLFDYPGADRLAVGYNGHWRQFDLLTRTLVTEDWVEECALSYAPDGRHATYVDGFDLWLLDRQTGVRRPLTRNGERWFAYGRTPENDTSPIANRARPRPVVIWSSDSEWLLTHQIDERNLPDSGLVQHAPAGGKPAIVHTFKLSAVGDPLPLGTIVAIHVSSGRQLRYGPYEIQAFSPIDMRTVWFSGTARVAIVKADRFSRRLELVDWDLSRDNTHVVISETVESGHLQLHPIFGLPPNVLVIPERNEVVWWSERSGWGHLYLYDLSGGGLKNAITAGDWLVRDIIGIDRDAGRILFASGSMDDIDPGRRRLCSIGLDGSQLKIHVAHDGDVVTRLPAAMSTQQSRPFRPANTQPATSPSCRHVVVRRTSIQGGASTDVVELASGTACSIARAEAWQPAPILFQALAADGSTKLNGALFLPPDLEPGRTCPLLDIIYPGPQTSVLPRGFGTRSEAQARSLAALGIAVFLLDTRHMPLRSRAIHQDGYGHQFEPQLSDHVAVIEHLCQEHVYLDRTRVGIMGVSGGGAATAFALFKYPDVFKAGVSASGNHDSRLYRSTWLDTFVGPTNLKSEEHSNSSHVAGLKGALLLVTGDMDDNVLPSQTMALASALIDANKDFELLVAPNEGHLALITSAYVQRRTWDFLVRSLIGGVPPHEFSLNFNSREKASYARALAREQAT